MIYFLSISLILMTLTAITLYLLLKWSIKDQDDLIKMNNDLLDTGNRLLDQRDQVVLTSHNFEKACGSLLKAYQDTITIQKEDYAALYKNALDLQEVALSWKKIATRYEEEYTKLLGNKIVSANQDKKALN